MALSMEIRERIAHAHENRLGTYEKIAEILGCGVATVSRILRRKRETGSVAAKPHAGGTDPKIDSRGLRLLNRWLAKKPDLTLEELTQKYNACKSTVKVSRATVGRAVHDRLGLTKKKTYRAAQRDREDVCQKRKAFVTLVQFILNKQFVFVDEAGCQLGMDRRYARSAPGTRAHCKRPFYRGDTTNLIGAVATDGFRCLWEVTGTVNGAMFTAFIEKGLAPKLRRDDVVVMDNLPGHKVEGVREAIDRRGAQLILLPPYSPDLNPIELLWAKLKEIIRSHAPKTKRAFSRALCEAMDGISQTDIYNWFHHCGYQFE